MKTLIVCVSEHHGNTAKIAEAMGAVLGASIIEPEALTDGMIGENDLLGFGSGIYFGKHHKRLIEKSRQLKGNHTRAFLFSTSGVGKVGKLHQVLRKNLEERGFEIIADYACRGFDTFGPLKLIGGINKKRPNDEDLNAAREFARSIEQIPG